MSDFMYTYPIIVGRAKEIKKTVESQYTKPNAIWSYYIAKAILTPNKSVKKITVNAAPNSTGNDFSRQIVKKDYLDMAKRLVKYVESNNRIPNYISVNGKNMRGSDFTYMFSRILVYYETHDQFPAYANVNSKAFTKPTETGDEIYKYFVKTFGKITCIDDALEKIAGRGYGYYYDDKYSNKESIDRIKNRQGINCTDATQMMKHVADGTGKYQKVDCVHVKCRGGDGHVYLKLTTSSGVFYRDPAAVLDSGVITKVWCSDGTVISINPSWWLANLNR